MDMTRLSYRLLRIAIDNSAYRSVLEALEEGIRESKDRIYKLAETDDEEWAETIVDEECELAENLIGAALVVCQAQITSVTSRAQMARARKLSSAGRFTAFGEGKKPVRDLGELLQPPATATRVEMLWALANYFKHRDEWPHDWANAAGHTANTIAVIQQAGVAMGSTSNLRTAARYLSDHDDYTQLRAFSEIIDSWAERVASAVKTELGIT